MPPTRRRRKFFTRRCWMLGISDLLLGRLSFVLPKLGRGKEVNSWKRRETQGGLLLLKKLSIYQHVWAWNKSNGFIEHLLQIHLLPQKAVANDLGLSIALQLRLSWIILFIRLSRLSRLRLPRYNFLLIARQDCNKDYWKTVGWILGGSG